ncbi:MAG: hypothetical protein RR959_08275, partial [Erysipelotrichaceae bacterium]
MLNYNGVHGAYGATKAMSEDVKELLARNKAYKTTLEHCNETCDDIDKLFNDALLELTFYNELTLQQERYIEKLFNHLNNEVKEQGTRKLRQAFVDYVL